MLLFYDLASVEIIYTVWEKAKNFLQREWNNEIISYIYPSLTFISLAVHFWNFLFPLLFDHHYIIIWYTDDILLPEAMVHEAAVYCPVAMTEVPDCPAFVLNWALVLET